MKLKYVLCLLVLFQCIACGSSGSSDAGDSEASLESAELVVSAGQITDFLWKPESDAHSPSPGTLAILVNACNADVRVNGTSLAYSGPSNGRCTTARGPRSGCGYGQNVKVEIIDPVSGVPYFFPTGEPFYIVTNGCNREEFR